MRRVLLAAFLAALLAPHARADVVWTISGCDANLDCAFTLTGDAGPVTISLVGGTFDYIGSGPTAGYETTPPIGNNADGLSASSVTITGPRSGRLDIDGTTSPSGGSITFGGVTAAFVPTSSTSSTARVVTSVAEQRVTVSWVNATQNTDCSPVPAWNSTDPARLVETIVQYGTAGALTNEVRSLMPASSMDLATTIPLAQLQVQAQHRTAAGTLSAVAGPAQIGSAPTTVAACVPPPPPPTNLCGAFTFSVRTWPGGITGARSLSYSSSKPIDRLDFGRSSTRVNRVTATDPDGCTVTVTR